MIVLIVGCGVLRRDYGWRIVTAVGGKKRPCLARDHWWATGPRWKGKMDLAWPGSYRTAGAWRQPCCKRLTQCSRQAAAMQGLPGGGLSGHRYWPCLCRLPFRSAEEPRPFRPRRKLPRTHIPRRIEFSSSFYAAPTTRDSFRILPTGEVVQPF